MARTLTCYSYVRPNIEEGTHYHFKGSAGLSAYYDALRPYSPFDVTLDNYRVNENLIKLKESAAVTPATMSHITYVIDHDEEAHYFRAYHVENCYMQSGYLVLEVKPDLWANGFFGGGVLYNLHVARCNRNIANGVYDAIGKTKGATYPIHLLPFNLTLAQCSAVFLLEYNVSQNLFGGDQITKTSLMYMSFQDIYDTLHNYVNGSFSGNVYDNIDIVAKVIDLLGGIHSVGGTIGTAGAQLNAHVLKVWFIPTEAIQRGTLGLHQVLTKSLLTEGNDMPFNDLVYEVAQLHYIKELDYKDYLQDPDTQWAEFMPDYHVEVGTLYRAMPISRFTQDTKAYFHYVFTNSSVNVYVEEGLQQEDITESFEVTITLNNATETSLISATKSLTKLAGGIASVAKGYAKGGYVGAAAGAAMYGVGLMASMKDAQPLQAIGTGDGALTFSQNNPTRVNSPYYLMVTASNENEKEHAYFKGVSYDLFYTSLNDIDEAAQLGQSYFTRTGFYIMADAMRIEGMQGSNADFVRNEFARGIWVKVL